MDPFYLKKLQIVLNDFFVAIKTITPESIEKEESRKEWINLNNSFSWQMYHKYPEHEIISEDMSARLHKYMLIICADMMTRDFTNKCPGCFWLLSFIDSELAKRRAEDLQGRVKELERPWWSRRGKNKDVGGSGERMDVLLEDLEKLSCSEKREED
jgi:hypothetical protein